MQLLRLLEERGYPARFSHIETFGPAGRSERFEAYIPAEKTFGIVKRSDPETLGESSPWSNAATGSSVYGCGWVFPRKAMISTSSVGGSLMRKTWSFCALFGWQ